MLSKFMEMKMQKEVHYAGKIYYHGLEIKRTSKMWYDTNYQTFYLTFKYVIPNIKNKCEKKNVLCLKKETFIPG